MNVAGKEVDRSLKLPAEHRQKLAIALVAGVEEEELWRYRPLGFGCEPG